MALMIPKVPAAGNPQRQQTRLDYLQKNRPNDPQIGQLQKGLAPAKGQPVATRPMVPQMSPPLQAPPSGEAGWGQINQMPANPMQPQGPGAGGNWLSMANQGLSQLGMQPQQRPQMPTNMNQWGSPLSKMPSPDMQAQIAQLLKMYGGAA